MLYKRNVFALVFILSSLIYAKTDKVSIALYDLKPYVVHKKEAAKITERFRFLLSNSNTLEVFGREEMEKVLKEKGFKEGRTCSKKNCLIRVGRLLGVDYMASGHVGRISGSYTISLLMVDIKHGKTVFDEIEICRGGGEKVMSKAVNKVANWLAGSLGGRIEKSVMLDTIPTDKMLMDTLGAKTEPIQTVQEDELPPETVMVEKAPPESVFPEPDLTESEEDDFLSADPFAETATTDPFAETATADPFAETATANTAAVSSTGKLFITATQEGASITIDGKEIDGTTPLSLPDIPVGKHKIVARFGSWYGSKDIAIQSYDVLNVNIDMQKLKGSIRISSKPGGALVTVDNRDFGVTPRKIQNIPYGKHVVQISKEGYITKEETITVSTQDLQEVLIQLEFSGASLTVKTDQPEAAILVDGKNVGKGSIESLKVKDGSISIRVEAAEYEKFDTTITLEPNGKATVSKKLISLYGSLKITSKPNKASVFLNESEVGKTPYENTKMGPGEYKLKLQATGCSDVTDKLSVLQNESLVKEYTLKYTDEFLKTMNAKKTKRKKILKNVRRITFGSLTLGFAGAGIYYHVKYKDAITIENNETGIDTYRKRRYVFLGLAGASAVGFAISIPF